MKTVMKTSKTLMCTGRGYSLYDAIFFYRVKWKNYLNSWSGNGYRVNFKKVTAVSRGKNLPYLPRVKANGAVQRGGGGGRGGGEGRIKSESKKLTVVTKNM